MLFLRKANSTSHRTNDRTTRRSTFLARKIFLIGTFQARPGGFSAPAAARSNHETHSQDEIFPSCPSSVTRRRFHRSPLVGFVDMNESSVKTAPQFESDMTASTRLVIASPSVSPCSDTSQMITP